MKSLFLWTSLLLGVVSLQAQNNMDNYDVTFYGICLEGSPENTYIQGSGTIGARITSNDFQTFEFELNPSFKIDSIYVNSKKNVFSRKGRFVQTDLKASQGEWVKVETFYHGEVTNNFSYFSGIAIEGDSRYQNSKTLYTLSAPENAYQWFPVKQVLTDKADSAYIHITTPQKYKGVSNGLLERTVELPDNRVRYEWETHYPIAFYLLSVTIGDYQELRETAHLPSGTELPVYFYSYNDEKCREEASASLSELVKMIEYCSEVLGEYPFANEKYGICMANIGGGMEHQTLTTQSDLTTSLTLHELLHQWFGDYVTCATWNHVWVNEGWAEGLTSAFYPEFGDPEYWLDFLESYLASSRTSKKTIYITDTDNPNAIFDKLTTYGKGSFLVRQLQYEVNNDELFFQALRTYLQRYAFSNATAYDLLAVLQEVTGRNFDHMFLPYFLGKGFPLYTLTWEQKGDYLHVTSQQASTDPDISLYQMHYDLSILSEQGEQTERVFQDEPVKEFVIPVKGMVTEVGMDPEFKTFSRLKKSANRISISSANACYWASFDTLSGYLVISHTLDTPLNGCLYTACGEPVCNLTGIGHNDTLPTANLGPGIYYLKLNSGNFSDCLKLVKTK